MLVMAVDPRKMRLLAPVPGSQKVQSSKVVFVSSVADPPKLGEVVDVAVVLLNTIPQINAFPPPAACAATSPPETDPQLISAPAAYTSVLLFTLISVTPFGTL